MHEPKDGYALLHEVRGLERLVRRVRREWRAFRDEPTDETLSDLRRATRRLDERLDRLGRRLAAEARSGSGDSPSGEERPPPHRVVAASRDLDGKIWGAIRAWKGVIETGDRASIGTLRTMLEAATRSAGVLCRALGGHGPPLRSGDSETGAERRPGSGGGETVAAEIEGMLWRIHTDWNQARTAPTPERMGLLADSLRRAATAAASLNALREDLGEVRFRRSLRLGREIHGGVRFLPWRDPFTGAYSREGFDVLASAELKRCRRYGRSFGVLLLRIGAPDLAGLRRAIGALRAEVREYDIVARYVDDLVVVGIPEGDAGAARRVASRALHSLREHGMGEWFRQLSYASAPADGSTLGGLVDAASSRLGA